MCPRPSEISWPSTRGSTGDADAHVWSDIGSDVRIAARRRARQPAATALAIVTLALAIGVAAAIFSVVDQLFCGRRRSSLPTAW
jgi:hypothetical protein